MTDMPDPDFTLDTVLVPIDVAAEQDRRKIFAIACYLARHHGARLEFLTVVPEAYLATTHDPEGLIAQMQERAGRLLQTLLAEQIPEDLEAGLHVQYGPVSGQILDTARALEASLILIHARRPGLQSYALGSIASRVANHAPCSVYVVRD